MKIRIIIQTMVKGETGFHRSEVWNGELELTREDEYLVKLSILGESEPQPIADIPFTMGVGHYMWIPPDNHIRDMMFPDGDDEDNTYNLN